MAKSLKENIQHLVPSKIVLFFLKLKIGTIIFKKDGVRISQETIVDNFRLSRLTYRIQWHWWNPLILFLLLTVLSNILFAFVIHAIEFFSEVYSEVVAFLWPKDQRI